MKLDERGMALPIVIAIISIVFVLLTLCISQTLRSQQTATLYQEMIRARYGAEGGIAIMRSERHLHPVLPYTRVMTDHGMVVRTTLYSKGSVLEIQSTAYARFGVKQVITEIVS